MQVLWGFVLTVNKGLLAFIIWSTIRRDFKVATQYGDFERDKYEQLNVALKSVLIDTHVCTSWESSKLVNLIKFLKRKYSYNIYVQNLHLLPGRRKILL